MAGHARPVREVEEIDAEMIAPPIKAMQQVTRLRSIEGIEEVDIPFPAPVGPTIQKLGTDVLADAIPVQGGISAPEKMDSLDDDIEQAMLAETKPDGAKPPGPLTVKTAAVLPQAARTTAFSRSSSTPVELDDTLIDKYGVEWLEWEPETLWQTIRLDFDTQIARMNQEKINAAKLLHLSDSFFRYWDTFEKVVQAFSNEMPLFDRVQDFTLGQAAWAMRQAAQIRKEPYQTEVLTYLALKAKEAGLIWLPPPLDVAQAELDRLNPPEQVALKPEIRERWSAFEEKNLKTVELKEDVFGVQLARLAAIEEMLKDMASA